MKIIVHFGHAKTGTTSLQSALSKNRSYLLKNGVYYPEISPRSPAHHMLQILFYPNESLWPYLIHRFGSAENARQFGIKEWQKICKGCARHKPKILLLSSEMFFGDTSFESQKRFFDLLNTLSNDIEPVLYIREPASYYLANTQEKAKSSSIVMPPVPQQIRASIENIEAAFETQMSLRIFERSQLINNDIVVDFVSTFLSQYVHFDKFKTQALNESMSAESMAIMNKFRKQNLPKFDRILHPSTATLRADLKIAESEFPMLHRPKLREGIAQSIQRASVDFLWLKDERNIEFQTLDYEKIDGHDNLPRLENPEISDLVEVNQKRLDQLVNSILFKRLTVKNHIVFNAFDRNFSLRNIPKNMRKITVWAKKLFKR